MEQLQLVGSSINYGADTGTANAYASTGGAAGGTNGGNGSAGGGISFVLYKAY